MSRRSSTTIASGLLSALIALVTAHHARASYIYNPNDFATQVISYSGPVDPRPAYNDPTAILGEPALRFNNNAINPNIQDVHRAKIVEAPINYGPGNASTRQPVVTVLPNMNGDNISIASVVVKMGQPISDSRLHPYGDDLIIFGNSFYLGSGGFLDDSTNMNSYTLTGDVNAHAVDVAVSPDNIHWFSFPTLTDGIQPYSAYRWNRSSASWTNEILNPTVPLNPAVYGMNVAGQSAATVLAAYGNSAGGTALDLKNAHDDQGHTLAQDSYSSIQYVRLSSTSDDYTVISGVAAVSVGVMEQPIIDRIGSAQSARAAPEPSALAVLGLGLMAIVRRRRVA